MKKKKTLILSILLSVVLIVLCSIFMIVSVLFLNHYIIPIFNIANSQTNNQETFLASSQSPDGSYDLEAYRTEPGATVDFSIRVYVIEDNQKLMIYDVYHEYDVEIIWVDNSTVSINGKKINLAQGEKFIN